MLSFIIKCVAGLVSLVLGLSPAVGNTATGQWPAIPAFAFQRLRYQPPVTLFTRVLTSPGRRAFVLTASVSHTPPRK